MHITLIGLTDQQRPNLSPAATAAIKRHVCFAGAARHHVLVRDLLPQGAQWLSVEAPLAPFLDALAQTDGPWVVFASGDPMFFGIGNTLQKHFPHASIDVHAAPSSLQLLAHALRANLGLYRTLSLTGRPWQMLDQCLIQGEERMAVLTDKQKTPGTIARRMAEHGYGHYTMHVGVKLGGEGQQIISAPVPQMADRVFDHPNCLLLEADFPRVPSKGIPETEFFHLEGRPNMITKMPIRLTTLAMMSLHKRSLFWDVGSCTGSVAIEAKLFAPHLQVVAFEKREESRDLIVRNCRQFGVPGIEVAMGDFTATSKDAFQKPDAVFLGGYGGQMEQMLALIDRYLLPHGVLGFNAVSEQSSIRFKEWCRQTDYCLAGDTHMVVNDHNPIWVLVAEKH
ncbi:MAG: precorrin-6y C5,15-methyltransferase (decarboxylating) subunit CbiE [Breznakibacter sp.]